MENKYHWRFSESYFSWEELYEKLELVSEREALFQTQKALVSMRQYHDGQYRKKTWYSEKKIPYIIHPLTMAWQAYTLGFRKDSVLAAILLHDVCEDCDAKVDELSAGDEVRKLVGLLTYEKTKDQNTAEAKRIYFDRIAQNMDAALIKVIDRCNNISTMAATFSRDRMIEYIEETEQYVCPLLQILKVRRPESAMQTFLLEYHLYSVLESIKNIICKQ